MWSSALQNEVGIALSQVKISFVVAAVYDVESAALTECRYKLRA
jgi:hypothetical protein